MLPQYRRLRPRLAQLASSVRPLYRLSRQQRTAATATVTMAIVTMATVTTVIATTATAATAQAPTSTSEDMAADATDS